MPQDNPMAYFDAGQKLGEGLGGSIGGTGGAQSRSFVRALALKKAGQEFQINKMAADLGIMTEYNNNTGKWDINPQFQNVDPRLLEISLTKANDRNWKLWAEKQRLKHAAYALINNAAKRYTESNGKDPYAIDEIMSNAAAAQWDESYAERYIRTLLDKESHEELLYNTWQKANLAYQREPWNMDLKSHVESLWSSRDYAKFRKDTQFTNPFTDELNKMQTRNKGVEQLQIEEEKKKEADKRRAIDQAVEIARQKELLPSALEKKSQTIYDIHDKTLAQSFDPNVSDMETFARLQGDRPEFNTARIIGHTLLGMIDTKSLKPRFAKNIANFAYSQRGESLDNLNSMELRIDDKTGQISRIRNGKEEVWTFGKWRQK